MSSDRRRFLRFSAATIVGAVPAATAWAEAYPSRPVRLIVAALPGGTADAIARLVAQWLSERLGQPFIIENRPGAGTNIGTESVVKSSPDGHTLLLVSPASAINATLYDKLSFNFLQDITPVAGIVSAPNVMEVHPSVPAKTIREFIAYARSHPGKISYASFGTGTSVHVAGELFKMMAGVDMIHVPYRGPAPALADLLAGRVQMLCDNILTSIEHIRAGNLIPLAVTTAKRSRLLPELPTVGEYLPGFEASNFFGIGAPKKTPPEVIERLNREINAGLADPRLRARLAEIGDPLPGLPSDFSSLLVQETEKWGKVIKSAGIKPD
jgi:tripartite-type tricarboxylate transporter receptor subunit TctC